MAGNVPVRQYKTSELISRFTKLAQTSQYYVHLAPTTETVVGGQTGSGAKKTFTQLLSSIGVDQGFVSGTIGMYCNEASLPGNSFATTEMNTDFPGVSQKFPYRKIYNDLQLTFYVDDQYKVIKFFEAWMSYIASPFGLGKAINENSGQNGSFRFNYPDAYKCNIYVAKFNKDATISNRIAYRFINAFPIDITSMPVSYDSSDVLRCTVSFSYDRYIFDYKGELVSPEVILNPENSPNKEPDVSRTGEYISSQQPLPYTNEPPAGGYVSSQPTPDFLRY